MYAYDAVTDAWTQLGQDLDGEAAGDQSGRSVSLSGDRVAIGAYLNDANGDFSGHTRVYAYDAGTDAWTQLGQDIGGEAAADQSGGSVSLSGDRVAIGAQGNDGNGDTSGHTRVYAYDAGTDAWTQLGQDLDGEAAFDQSGWSVSLSGDRVAIGAINNDGNGSSSGQTRVYAYDAGTDAWTQLGQDLDGEAAGDQSGISVSLSGDRVAIGARLNDANGTDSGQTRVYAYDAGTDVWTQLGQDLDGEAAGDESGWSVSLSGDRVAIGAYLNDGNGDGSGHTRVYAYEAPPPPVTLPVADASLTFPGGDLILPAGRGSVFVTAGGTFTGETGQRFTIFLRLDGPGGYSRIAKRGEIKPAPGGTVSQSIKLSTLPQDPAGDYTVTLLIAEGSVPMSAAGEAEVFATLPAVKLGGAGLRAAEALAVYPNPADGRGDAALRCGRGGRGDAGDLRRAGPRGRASGRRRRGGRGGSHVRRERAAGGRVRRPSDDGGGHGDGAPHGGALVQPTSSAFASGPSSGVEAGRSA